MSEEKAKAKHEESIGLQPQKYGTGIRHLQMFCMMISMTTIIIARASMGVAVLAMSDVRHHNVTIINDSHIESIEQVDTKIVTYDWDKKTQSLILSSFFWGYVIMQLPAGILAKKFGGKIIMLVALLANSLISLLMPTLAAMGGWKLVCAARVAMGLTQACLFPATHTLIGQWLPDSERTTYTSVVYGGMQIGNIIALPVSGILADTAIGWKLIFYGISVILFVNAVIWYWFAASSPREHRMISVEERRYIEAGLNVCESHRPATPWKHILRCVPMWVILAPNVSFIINFILFFVDMPTYLEKGLKISLKSSAILSGLPYVGMWFGGILSSMLSEWIMKKGWISRTANRKLFQSIALLGAAAGLVVLSFLGPENKWMAVIVIIIIMTVTGFSVSGFLVNQLDLSPNYGGVILSILNFLGNFASILMPIATSYILRNDSSDISRWRWVFWMMSGFSVITTGIYIAFGTSERQPWDDPNFLIKESADPEESKPVLTKDTQKENVITESKEGVVE